MTDSIYFYKHSAVHVEVHWQIPEGKYPENQRNREAVFRRKNVELFPGEFLFFPTGNGRKSSGKCLKNSRPEYCFHVPLVSGVFLRVPEFFWLFSAGSSSIWCQERLTWVIKFSFSRNLSTKYCRPK